MRKASVVLSLLIPLFPPAAPAGSIHDAVMRQSQENFPEFLELLSIPNIPDRPEDIRRNAAFLEKAFARRGFETKLLDNAAGRPTLYASLRSRNARAATVLLYAHFDGQPVIAENWSQSDPFVPVVKQRGAGGQWREVSRERLFERWIDPELRVFARSAADDKAPIMMLLTAIDVLASEGKSPAINVKVLLDPEEEIGSPNLAAVVERDRSLFAADALAILDGPQHPSGRATLVFGNRGIAQATLTVFGPPDPLHSGHFGNYAPNPAQRLARLLASMKDEDGRVLVSGYYDGVQLSDADRAVLAAVDDNEAELQKRIGVAQAEKVGGNYQEALQFPSLNVRGMAAAGVGSKAANIVPSEAVAEIDLRTTPESDGRKQFELIKRHIERQGYHLVEGPPGEADRARHAKLASFRLISSQDAVRVPMDAPVGRWAARAMRSATAPDPSQEPVRIRMMGGTVPTDVLVDALRLPFILIPIVNADNNQHAHDENLRVGNFVTGTEVIYSLLVTAYEK